MNAFYRSTGTLIFRPESLQKKTQMFQSNDSPECGPQITIFAIQPLGSWSSFIKSRTWTSRIFMNLAIFDIDPQMLKFHPSGNQLTKIAPLLAHLPDSRTFRDFVSGWPDSRARVRSSIAVRVGELFQQWILLRSGDPGIWRRLDECQVRHWWWRVWSNYPAVFKR